MAAYWRQAWERASIQIRAYWSLSNGLMIIAKQNWPCAFCRFICVNELNQQTVKTFVLQITQFCYARNANKAYYNVFCNDNICKGITKTTQYRRTPRGSCLYSDKVLHLAIFACLVVEDCFGSVKARSSFLIAQSVAIT